LNINPVFRWAIFLDCVLSHHRAIVLSIVPTCSHWRKMSPSFGKIFNSLLYLMSTMQNEQVAFLICQHSRTFLFEKLKRVSALFFSIF
jgi:hypothetical protein